MGKASIQNVLDLGFKAEQFGTPADFEVDGTGYVARVLADAATWAAGKVGQGVYDAATAGLPLLRLKNAELCYAKAELWERRAAFIDANANQALDQFAPANRREYKQHAQSARECAQFWIDEFITDGRADQGDSAVTSGFVESGRFPPSIAEVPH